MSDERPAPGDVYVRQLCPSCGLWRAHVLVVLRSTCEPELPELRLLVCRDCGTFGPAPVDTVH